MYAKTVRQQLKDLKKPGDYLDTESDHLVVENCELRESLKKEVQLVTQRDEAISQLKSKIKQLEAKRQETAED